MAVSTGLGFDLQDVLKDAKAADIVLDKLVEKSVAFTNNMNTALSSHDLDRYKAGLLEMKQMLDSMSKSKLNIDINHTKVNECSDAIINLTDVINKMKAIDSNLTLFDTKGIYASNQGILTLSDALDVVRDKMNDLRRSWNEFDEDAAAKDSFLSSGLAPMTKKGQPYKEGHYLWKRTFEEYKQCCQDEIEEAKKKERLKLELEMQALVEREAILNKELQYAQMTADQKAEYLKRKTAENLAAEKKAISEIQSAYKEQMVRLEQLNSQIGRFDTQKNSKVLTQEEQATYDVMVQERDEVQSQLETMYMEHQDELSKIAANAAMKRAEMIKQLEGRAYTPDEAISFADMATTGNQYKEALKMLENALMNVDSSTNTYKKDVSDLNAKIMEMRQRVEDLTAAQHAEQRLTPTIANEYKRLTKELYSTQKAMDDLRETSAFKANEQEAIDAMNAMKAHEQDVANARQTIINAQGQKLVEIDRAIANERAQAQLKVFEEAEKKRAELEKKYGTISQQDAEDVLQDSQNVENIRQAEEAIKKLTEARDKLDKNSSDYSETVARLNKEIERQKDAIEEVTDATKAQQKQEEKNVTKDTKSALSYSQQAKSVEQLQRAIKYLETVRKKEDLTTANGRRNHAILTAELERQQRRYEELTGSMKKSQGALADFAGQMGKRVVQIFSVNALKNYVEKLAEVRGEFELQNKALQAILQNKDEADKLWSKTVELAVRSPFRVSELVKYTKQLAAYRIEADKLYDTNKMLADISAGLGVDMERLILAYGQVKAANYLRGTELRQFSEAGVNILGELAAYFTELEGRAVSVGDVFERVSKRMVSFKDVEHVLSSMTREGGIFFQMQEIQANTLKGQLSNLKDSIDIMLNDIGEANDGALKTSVALVRKMVENWERLVPIVKSILAGVSSFFILSKGWVIIQKTWQGLVILSAALRGNITRVTAAQKLFNIASAANVWFAAAAVIVGAIVAVTSALKKASEEQRKFNDTVREGERDAGELSTKFETLANIAVDDTQGIKKQTQAIEELKRTYEGIVPIQNLTIAKLKEMNGNYESMTRSIYANIEAKTREKLQDQVREAYIGQINSAQDTMAKRIKQFGVSEETTMYIMSKFNTQLSEGLIKTSDEAVTAINELLAKFSNLKKEISWSDVKWVGGESLKTYKWGIYEVVEANNMLQQNLAKWKNYNLYNVMSDAPIFTQLMEEFQAITDTRKDIKAFNRDGENEGFKLSIEFDEVQKERYIKKLNDFISEINNLLSSGAVSEKDVDVVRTVIQRAEEEIRSFDISSIDKQIKEHALRISKATGVDLGLISEAVKDEMVSLDDYIKQLKETVERYDQETARLEDSGASKVVRESILGTYADNEEFDAKLREFKQKGEAIRQLLLAIEASALDKDDDKGASKDRTNEELKARVKLYHDMNEYYKKLLQYEEKELAIQKTKEAFSQRAAQLGVSVEGIDYQSSLKKTQETLKVINESSLAYSYLLAGGMDAIEATAKVIERYDLRNTARDIDEWLEELKAGLRKVEGFREEAYQDQGGVWTIGYGFTKDVKEGDRMTLQAAEERLNKEVQDHTKAIIKMMNDGLVDFNKNQFMALSDLAYQAGPGAAIDIIKAAKGDVDYIANALRRAGTTIKGEYQSNLQGRADSRVRMFTADIDTIAIREGETIDEYISRSLEKFANKEKMLQERIANYDPFGDTATIDRLTEERASFTADKYIEYLDQELSKLRVEAGIAVRVIDLEQAQQEVSSIFTQLDLSEELEGAGITKEMALQFGFEFIDYDKARKMIDDLAIQGTGDLFDKVYSDALKNLDKREEAQAKERMKTYSKYLTSGMNEAVKIKIEEMRKVSEIEKLALKAGLSKSDKDRMVKGVQDETRESMASMEWEEFKKSDMYTMMFEDLEFYGTKALENLKGKIDQLKVAFGTLQPTQVKEIVSQLNKIDDVLMERNPFKYAKSIKELTEDIGTEESNALDMAHAQARHDAAKADIDIINTAIAARARGLKLTEKQLDAYTALVGEGEQSREMERVILALRQEELDTSAMQIETAKANILLLNKEKQATISKLNKSKEYLNSIQNGLQAGKDLLELVQGEEDTVASTIAEAGLGMLSLIQSAVAMQVQFVAMGIAANSALGVIGWIAIAIQAVVTVLSALFKAHDKSLQKEIDGLQKNVENLQKAFEKLSESMDKSFDMEQYNSLFREAQQNLDSQISTTQRMIALEEDKKKTDKDAIEEYRENIREYEEQKREMEKKRIQDMGGIGQDEYKTAAENFVNAWLDAFRETGDGLSGLNDQFDEFVNGVIRKQLLMRGTSAFLEPLFKQIDTMVTTDSEGGTKATEREFSALNEEAKTVLPQLSDFLTKLLESFGSGADSLRGNMSELSRGIQGITESQAEVIESYLNSLRFYVAANSEELKNQTKYMRNIFNILDSVTTTNSIGKKGIRSIL